ncbi:MAG: metabolite traffic protein EboE, partial [Nitrospirales bacterium]|nr:metabolite traffic protein EboE [Nitrospirales bacterium]
MKLSASKEEHLTYCTNIHPAENWGDVRKNFEKYVLPVKKRFVPHQPFGVGLRLSAVAADELASLDNQEEFKAFLSDHNLYIFTINGFPYGSFHGVSVKAKVYFPDWRHEERLRYTKILADLLAALLPSQGVEIGSISTVPGGIKPEIRTANDIERMASLLVDIAIYLINLRAKTGKTVTLALEPEPCCFLGTVEETIVFFRTYIFSSSSIQRVANHTGLSPFEAETALRSHLGVCLDLCHAAVMYEAPQKCIEVLRQTGIQIFKMQISAGLMIPSVTPTKIDFLRQFDDGVYLHQVVERRGSRLVPWLDLDQAIAELRPTNHGCEWRIHFHVPIFANELGEFWTTQEFIRQVLHIHRKQPISSHLEVETYTW